MVVAFFLCIGPLVLPLIEQVKCFLHVRNITLRQSLNNFVGDLQIHCSFLQQIVYLFIVYLEIRYFKTGLGTFIAEYVSERVGDHAFSRLISQHCVGFTRSRLTVHKNCGIVACQKLLNDTRAA